ncbi:MAG: hypothetical protein ACO1QB_14455 [Verrucomicrobiales bacterium]
MKKQTYSRVLSFGCAIIIAALSLTSSFAADKSDPSGAWKWSMNGRNGETREVKLNIKKENGKLVGSMSGRQGQDTPIENIKVEDDGKITFVVKRERNGRSFETKYVGKIEGDTIKGETKFTNQNGEERSREWAAKREASSVTGVWNTAFTRPDGNKMEYKINLKQEGDKLTGNTIRSNGDETPIKEGTVKGNEVSFKVVRERDGRSFTSAYNGKIEGDTIKGKVEVDWTGEKRSFDWEAKKGK